VVNTVNAVNVVNAVKAVKAVNAGDSLGLQVSVGPSEVRAEGLGGSGLGLGGDQS
jgi:hypothetical protein